MPSDKKMARITAAGMAFLVPMAIPPAATSAAFDAIAAPMSPDGAETQVTDSRACDTSGAPRANPAPASPRFSLSFALSIRFHTATPDIPSRRPSSSSDDFSK